jgi:hypothetical protein
MTAKNQKKDFVTTLLGRPSQPDFGIPHVGMMRTFPKNDCQKKGNAQTLLKMGGP